MPDDPKKPTPAGIPALRITEKSRAGSHHDHRAPSPPIPIPIAVEMDEVTGKYEGDELKSMRARRPTDERITRLEEKHDKLESKVDKLDGKVDQVDDKVDKMAVSVAGMEGQFKVIPRLVDSMEKAIESMNEREHVKFTATVDVDKAKQLSKVEIEAAEKKDEIDAGKAKREWITKAFAIGSTIAAIVSTLIAAGRC